MKPSTLLLPRPCRHRSRGMVLIVCLLMLVIMALLSVSIYNRFGQAETMAGNTREKQRALEAAQGAMQAAQWWLQNGTLGAGTLTGGNCPAGVVRTVDKALTQVDICTNALGAGKVEKSRWDTRYEFTPSGMAVASGGGLADSGDIQYAEPPAFYIQYLGNSGGTYLYRVSARGTGGTPDAVAELESVVEVKTTGASGTTSLSGS